MKAASVLDSKKKYRSRLRKRLAQLSVKERLSKSRTIAHRLFSDPIFQRAKHILCYAALPTEVQTRIILKECLRLKKRLYLPVISGQGKGMRIFRISDLKKDFCLGFYGIPEPRQRAKRKGRVSDLNLVIVPGLGFDRKGYRLGRGGGYFDRFLVKAKKACKIGLAFREQIVKKIPVLDHDTRMDKIYTD